MNRHIIHDSALANPGHSDFTCNRIERWDSVARKSDNWKSWGAYYHCRLRHIYQCLIMPGQRVLEIGCGQGDLLASLSPAVGVGIDFSSEMIQRATRKYPGLRFIQTDVHDLNLEETFDVIILSDLVNDLWNVQEVFERITDVTTSGTRVILNFYSHLWEKPIEIARQMGLATSTLSQNWLTVEDLANLLFLADFEVIRHWEEILWPLSTPLLAPLANRYLVRFLPFKWFALTNFIMARPRPRPKCMTIKPSVSVVVPARNEAGNIPEIFRRVPEMGSGIELFFVEGHSTDDTYSAIERAMADNPGRRCKLLRQTGIGKGDAVRLAFSQASGDILMILDADLTVPPEDLHRFYEALCSEKAEFVNGVRLVYPMGEKAMRFFNLLGNKFFSMAFSWLLGQPVKDTLCGTKVLSRDSYRKIEQNRAYFGDFDPFGDFDLLFGAAKLNLKIVDLPVRYHDRTYGTTNIQRWKHGWLLLRMVLFAATKIKFV